MTTIIQPTYVAILPSNSRKVTFRPFTVKEEKALLLALQESDPGTITEALKSVVSACTNGEVDPAKIPYYDTEYLYLQIRSKSVGEMISLIGSCECSETAKTPFEVDITSDLSVNPKPVPDPIFKIKDTPYSIKIRHPSIDNFTTSYSVVDSATKIVADCILSIFTDEEVLDWDLDKKLEFVESMSPLQQKDISTFIRNMPLVQLKTTYKCEKCGKEHESILSGFENFFV